ncbi:MAG TPA: glycosyltransferase [Terriglobia bacterium]|nr:glycosyltransferase [Terriglobia bacterium]
MTWTTLDHALSAIESTTAYMVAVAFYGLYPIITSLIYVATAFIYYARRPIQPAALADADLPPVTVIVPAYCEGEVIERSVEGVLTLDYPRFELIVVNDGSTDDTADKVRVFLSDSRVRLLDKKVNEGKAMALNDAILCARHELILIMDADAVPDRQLLRKMVPHFQSARVGAVAGNPRVRNASNLLSRLQAIEFSSVIGLMRRAQRIWGRVMCVSGVVGMFRKSAIADAGMFTPGMATEDIDLTWKLQSRFYDVRYEGAALVWMIVPEDMGVWWKQRKRWALGLGQVLRRHATVFTDWRLRRMQPLYIESALSYLWALTFIVVTIFWIFCYAVGHPPKGGSPIPNFWGMLLYTFCLIQLACGTWLDSKYDPEIVRHYPVSIIYPTFYWFLLTVTSFIYTTRGLVKRIDFSKPTRWHIQHTYVEKS